MLVILVRTILLFFLVILALRIMGKRQIGELQPAELVVTILISELATEPMQEPAKPLFICTLPIIIIITLEILISVLTMKSNKVRHLFAGKPEIIVENGAPNQSTMRKLRFTIHDLTEQLRINGVFDISQVKYAIVETNGQLSVLLKGEDDTPTAKDLGVKTGDDEMPFLIISDGKKQKSSMLYIKMSDSELDKILKKENIKIEQIFMMQCDKNRKYSIIGNMDTLPEKGGKN